jgi:hypothetical protein
MENINKNIYIKIGKGLVNNEYIMLPGTCNNMNEDQENKKQEY